MKSYYQISDWDETAQTGDLFVPKNISVSLVADLGITSLVEFSPLNPNRKIFFKTGFVFNQDAWCSPRTLNYVVSRIRMRTGTTTTISIWRPSSGMVQRHLPPLNINYSTPLPLP